MHVSFSSTTFSFIDLQDLITSFSFFFYRCPIMGCGSKNFIKITDLEEDDNLMDMLSQNQTHNVHVEIEIVE